MAGQTWATIQQAVKVALAQAPSPYTGAAPDFDVIFPQAVSYAENRIARDIPMLANRREDTSTTTIAAQRTINVASTGVLSIEGVCLISPAGTSAPSLGERSIYNLATIDWIDQFWPNESSVCAPDAAEWIGRWAAIADDHTIIVAPTPDASYQVAVTGLFPPTPLTADNQSSYISATYPELLEAAIMEWMSGWLQRNYGMAADDSPQGLAFGGEYSKLLTGARTEELRRRGMLPNVPPMGT